MTKSETPMKATTTTTGTTTDAVLVESLEACAASVTLAHCVAALLS